MNRIHSGNPLLWLGLLLLAWAVLGVQLATPKVASGPFYAATEHHLGVTRWEAAPRLGLDAWTTKFASGDTVGAKGTGNITAHSADDIRFSQNTVSFNKTDRVTGTNYTYNDLVQSMRTNGWKGDPVDVVKMPDGKLTSMDNTRIAAAREAGIEVKATVRGFDDPLTPAIQEARGWQNFSTWGEAITARINKQSGGFSNSNPYGSSGLPRVTGGR